MSREIEFYIVDILIAIDKIKRYTAQFSYANELLSMQYIGMVLLES